MKDKFDEWKEEAEEVLTKKLNIRITSWLRVTFNGLRIMKKVAASYVDLVTDAILLGTVMAVVKLSSDNFTLFPSQIAFVLLSTVIVPLLTSSLIIAFTRPFVILGAHQWKELSGRKGRIPFGIAGLICFLFSPLVPAMIIIATENAEERLKSLKLEKEEKPVKDSAVEECNMLTEFINETRQG